MCGIIGYVGRSQALPVLVQGIRLLSYRGYDSAGVAVHDGTTLRIPLPELNEERRKQLVKIAHQYAESARIAAISRVKAAT